MLKKLDKYLKKQKRKFQSLLATPRMKCTPDTFHDLRVEIKKLKSFLSLLKYSAKNFNKKKSEKPFGKIFKLAGEIREIHIEEEMLENYFSIDFLREYRQKLKERKSTKLREYTALIDQKSSEINKTFSNIRPWISQVNKEKTTSFIEKNSGKIFNLLEQENIQPSQIHLLRKRIKQYNYSIKYLKKSTQPLTDTDYLNDLTGKWHDRQVLLTHLDKQIHSLGINAEEREQIEKIRNEQTTINSLLFNEIKEAVGKLKEQKH